MDDSLFLVITNESGINMGADAVSEQISARPRAMIV
jgi:hypothetical protein